SCCFVTFNMTVLLVALLTGVFLGYNFLIGLIDPICNESKQNDLCNDIQLLWLSGGALLVAYTCLCVAIVLELLMMLCHLSTRKQNQRQGLPRMALAGVLVSVSCFGAVQRKCGNDIYCILNIGGDVILALLCLVLLVISLFQIMHGVWSTCTLLLQFLVLIFGLLLAIVLLAYLIACSTGKKSCVPKDNDGSYIYMSQGALSVCFCALFASLAMQTLLLCCCRKRTRSTSQELDDNNWIDNDRIMKRKKYADFD
uniref:Uncharacterized protein n=1 Tax=Amphimedon queenslandica TaxID=400682 RepID=A0A1X7VEK1_AMPQE